MLSIAMVARISTASLYSLFSFPGSLHGCIHCSLFSFPTREHDIGPRQVHTSVDWNGVLEVEHGLLPVGRCVLGTSAERQGVALHIKYNIKVANESLAWWEEERNERGVGIQRESRDGM